MYVPQEALRNNIYLDFSFVSALPPDIELKKINLQEVSIRKSAKVERKRKRGYIGVCTFQTNFEI